MLLGSRKAARFTQLMENVMRILLLLFLRERNLAPFTFSSQLAQYAVEQVIDEYREWMQALS